MREQLTALVNVSITILLILVVAFIPLIFAPLTTEYYETPKLILLTGVTLVLLLLWAINWVLKGRVVFARSPLDIPLILLLIVIILSSIFSGVKDVSIYGSLPRVHGSAVSWISYILLYFIATSHLKDRLQVKTVIYTFLTSTTLVSIFALLSFFGIYPLATLFNFTGIANFNPTGSSFSAAVLMILSLPILLVAIVTEKTSDSLIPQPAAILLASFYGITLVLTANPLSMVIALLGVGLTFYSISQRKNEDLSISGRNSLFQKSPLLLIPVVASLLVFALSFLPLGSNFNPLQERRVNFPREIQLPFVTSWKISVSSFRDNPFLGSGPSTYLFDFTEYKPIEHNNSRFWNIRFDLAFNEFMQFLATLGGLGLLALLFLAALNLVFAWRGLSSNNPLLSGLSISGILVVALLVIHTSTVVSIVASLIILALLMALSKSTGKVEELSLGIKASKITDSNLVVGDALPLILFIPILFFVVFAFWNMRAVVLADLYHRLALNSASTRGLDTYNNLVKAEQLNPKVDLYRTDLAQTNFALANAIAASKGPTESSPAGSLTDQDKRNIQQLLSQSINEGRVAVSLNPRNSQNWEILASIYRQVSGVAQNALAFSLDAYGRAIQRDPLNPILRLNVGGIYYSIKNYDLAIRFFTDAANLKPDYANAYYNLSVALRDRGDLNAAQSNAERLVSLLDPQSRDFKVATDYLADLKNRIATNSAEESAIRAPAGLEESALQNKELPDVLDEELKNKPENIATPEAIKR